VAPPEEVGEEGYELGDWLSSLIIRICSSRRRLSLDAVSLDRARSRAGGGFCNMLVMLGSFSAGAGVV
jgi:hypothetical protein